MKRLIALLVNAQLGAKADPPMNTRLKNVKMATLAEGDPTAKFSIATTPMCRGGHYSIPLIDPLYP